MNPSHKMRPLLVIYLHGFASSGQAHKAELLRTWCAQHQLAFIAPSLPIQPQLALSSVQETLAALLPFYRVGLVGASLGGFYARYLAQQAQLPCVLINPVVNPAQRLQEAIGAVTHYHDQLRFSWTQEHCQSLVAYRVEKASVPCRLLLQTGDDVLDYRQAQLAYPEAELCLEEGGDHGFTGFERHIPALVAFLDQHAAQ